MVPNDQNHQSSSSSSSRPASASSGNPFMVVSFNKTEPLPLPLRISATLRGLTENYSPTYYSCGNPCLDFFFHVVPDCINPDTHTPRYRLKLAWEHDALTTLKLISHLRSVRGTGKFDREGFYTAALWLHENHPKALAHNIKWIPQFGSFKDLPEILYRILKGSDVWTVAYIKQQRLKWKMYEDEVVLTFESSTGSWVELAKDPSTGCVYCYKECIGKSEWVSPSMAAALESPSATIPPPPDWEGDSICICRSDNWNLVRAWGYCNYCRWYI